MKAKLSPIMRRRLANFRSNTRGFISFCIFLLLLAVVLPAEFVANDKPIALKLKGTWYFPVVKAYSEVDLGGDFETEADYRDPFVAEDLVEAEGGWMLWPPIRWSYDTVDQEDDAPAPAPPSRRHLLGTDDHGRDVVARAIYGFRISVLFGFTLTGISTVIGMLLGLWQRDQRQRCRQDPHAEDRQPRTESDVDDRMELPHRQRQRRQHQTGGQGGPQHAGQLG